MRLAQKGANVYDRKEYPTFIEARGLTTFVQHLPVPADQQLIDAITNDPDTPSVKVDPHNPRVLRIGWSHLYQRYSDSYRHSCALRRTVMPILQDAPGPAVRYASTPVAQSCAEL